MCALRFLGIASLLIGLASAAPAQVFTPIVLTDDTRWSEGGNWIDYDGDGDLDLFVPNNPRSPTFNSLYENQGDGTFVRLTTGAIAQDIVMSESGTWGDIDNDGDLDLFIADGGFDRPRLNSVYFNQGDGQFQELRDGPIVTGTSYSTSSSWVDYDNDGHLDLFVANLYPANAAGVAGPDFLYRNNGDATFTQVTTGPLVTDRTVSFGIAWSDYDNDGDPDVVVTNNRGNDNFYRNDGGGTFTKLTAAEVGPLASSGGAGIGASWGDYDNDGDPDLFITNFAQNDFFYRNQGDGSFEVVTGTPLTTSGGIGEGSAWGDYDKDGDLDLFVANGGANNDVNFLFANQLMETGTASFTRIAGIDLVTRVGCYAGAMWGDYDDDGDLDLFVSNFSGKSSLIYRNEQPDGHWLNVRAIGDVSNRSAIGAKLRARATIQGQVVWQLREIAGQTGYNAQNSLRAHFGLGDATVVDTLQIEWPSGLVDVYTEVAADQFLVANEGETLPVHTDATPAVPDGFALSPNYPNPFNPTTTFSVTLPQEAPVRVTLFDALGQVVRVLHDGRLPAGTHALRWDGTDAAGRPVPAGTYLYRLAAPGVREARTMVLVK